MLLRGVKEHTTTTTTATTTSTTTATTAMFTTMDLKFHLLLEPHEII
jgi:hypothetical protein